MSTINEAAHIDAMWWLLTSRRFGTSFYKPGDIISLTGYREPITDYALVLNDPVHSTVRTIRAPTREGLLDGLVGIMVAERLT